MPNDPTNDAQKKVATLNAIIEQSGNDVQASEKLLDEIEGEISVLEKDTAEKQGQLDEEITKTVKDLDTETVKLVKETE